MRAAEQPLRDGWCAYRIDDPEMEPHGSEPPLASSCARSDVESAGRKKTRSTSFHRRVRTIDSIVHTRPSSSIL